MPWPDLALGGFRKVSKKWTDQCEVCDLKKKKVTVRVGHFLKENEPSKKGDVTGRLNNKLAT